jgi:tetratricopeptide (TPR) repeat protein
MLLVQWGEKDRGLGLLEQVIQQNPYSREAQQECMAILLDRGDHKRARLHGLKAIVLAPGHAIFYRHLGIAFQQAGDFELAEKFSMKGIFLDPSDVLTYLVVAASGSSQGKTISALKRMDQTLVLAPNLPNVMLLRGQILRAARRFEDALLSFERSILSGPTDPSGYLAKAELLIDFQQYSAALETLIEAQNQTPNNQSMRLAKANALRGLKQVSEAYKTSQLAVTLAPSEQETYLALGKLALDLGNLSETLSAYKKCLKINPESITARCARASANIIYRRLGDASEELKDLESKHPQDVTVRNALSSLQLLQEDYLEGWRNFEWRWKASDRLKAKIYHDAPLWDGAALNDRSLLIYPEIGFGDFLMFSRYFERLFSFADRVALIVPDALFALYEAQNYPFKLVRESDPVPPHDVQCPIMSLPLAFLNQTHAIPDRVPYLVVPETIPKNGLLKSDAEGCFKIGLAWSGHQFRGIDLCPARQRSIRFSALEPILGRYSNFHCIQKDIISDEIPLIELDTRLIRHDSEIFSFLDTASLINQMDLILTIDTSIAHLAGALGKETWVLLPYSTDYRWHVDGEKTRWYPQTRLFRQSSPGDWVPVIQKVADALALRLSA